MFDRPKRREIITLMGGAAAASLLSSGAARAQQGARVRRIGVLHDYVDSDPEGQAQLAAFRGELKKLGWTALGLDVPAQLLARADEVIE